MSATTPSSTGNVIATSAVTVPRREGLGKESPCRNMVFPLRLQRSPDESNGIPDSHQYVAASVELAVQVTELKKPSGFQV